MGTIKIQDGLEVEGMSWLRAKVLYHQSSEYFRHGISVSPEDIVIDVGANYGLFSLEVLRRSGGRANVICIEPVPSVGEKMAKNLKRNFPSSNIVYLPNAVASKSEITTFYYRPLAPELSSVNTNIPSLQSDKKSTFANQIGAALAKFVSVFVDFWKVELSCRTVTLDNIIAERSLSHIDLLKIDVEGAELSVLEGLSDPNARKIQKVVIEVHDIEGRVEAIQGILRRWGFEKIVVDQEFLLKNSNIYNIYASRAESTAGN